MDREERASALSSFDPDVFSTIADELSREQRKINLIASENYASRAVLEAQGSVLTNKYAEGYPGKRYYSGCESVDEAETIAIQRARKLFGCEHANVQPHAGAPANMAVYQATIKPGETLMAMDLRCGGHLTHGSTANFSGMLYRVVHYGLDRKTETLDYDAIAEIARVERPRIIVAGGSSYSRKIDFAAFRSIADEVGAALMVDMAHFGGLVVGGVHPDPVPHADYVTGTTHKTLRGPRGGFILTRSENCERIDAAVFPGIQGGPLMHIIAAKAVCFKEAMEPSFKVYAETIVANASALAGKLDSEGFRIVSGGTETHLFLVDLRPVGISGHQAQDVLDSVDINTNMNEIPYDPTPPTVTSGIRIGTPAVTTRGMRPDDMDLLGSLISRALKSRGDESVLKDVRGQVAELSVRFPIYE
ncbi:MAG TPA: serine hydroxymethyltransferase [Candidatus Anoxymicrobiaceae bacterium]